VVTTGVKLAVGVLDTGVTKTVRVIFCVLEGDGLLPGVAVLNGVEVNVAPPPPPPPPPSFTRVWVWNTGRSVRVGVTDKVGWNVIVTVGVNDSVAPVIGRRKAKNAWVGPGVWVGVKNIRANACCVISLSGDRGVGEFLG
jgi:hypothetical protein